METILTVIVLLTALAQLVEALIQLRLVSKKGNRRKSHRHKAR